MKTQKITIGSCSYPMFIDSHLIARLGEICDLYRFPATRIVITDQSTENPMIDRLRSLENCHVLYFPPAAKPANFQQLEQIYATLPWQQLASGVTLIALGEEPWLEVVNFAIALLHVPVQLINVPISLWSMVEMGVSGSVILDWHDQSQSLTITPSPRLVLLDLDCLSQADAAARLLGVAGLLRHFSMTKSMPSLVAFVEGNSAASNPDVSLVPLLEELTNTRLSLLLNSEGRAWLGDFGKRWCRSAQTLSEAGLVRREKAVLVLLEIAWRWRVAVALGWCEAQESESMLSLMEKICRQFQVNDEEWLRARSFAEHFLSAANLAGIYLPETFGKLKYAAALEIPLAQQCLVEAAAGSKKSKTAV